jgi:hypothetical protein
MTHQSAADEAQHEPEVVARDAGVSAWPGTSAATARLSMRPGSDGPGALRSLVRGSGHAGVLALQRSIGNAAVNDLVRAGGARRLQRVAFGTDGELSPTRQATVRKAADIAERLVAPTNGLYGFRQKWDAFWSGPAKSIQPKPTLEQYQAAVRGRVVNDMDSSTRPEVRAVIDEDRGFPLERHTAAVTPVSSPQTYMRRFAIDQGVDSVVSLLLHESLHGAGLPMGPLMTFEPLFHQFEADVGFPLMMGGADVVDITQARRGDLDLEVKVTYRLRRIDEPLPAELEIQIVSPETGEVVYDEQPDGTRKPASQRIPGKPGQHTWVWRARNPGWASYAVRIRDLTSPTLLASKDFEANPRCVIGVSSKHCEDDK